jgi:hypothetical protein
MVATLVLWLGEFWALLLVFLFLLEQPSRATANTTASAAVITAVAGMPSPKIRPKARPMLRGVPGSADFICVILITSAAHAASIANAVIWPLRDALIRQGLQK